MGVQSLTLERIYLQQTEQILVSEVLIHFLFKKKEKALAIHGEATKVTKSIFIQCTK